MSTKYKNKLNEWKEENCGKFLKNERRVGSREKNESTKTK